MTLLPLSPKQILEDQLKIVHKKKGSEREKIMSEVKSLKEKSVMSAQKKNRELRQNIREKKESISLPP